jgi:hypothetical protein
LSPKPHNRTATPTKSQTRMSENVHITWRITLTARP